MQKKEHAKRMSIIDRLIRRVGQKFSFSRKRAKVFPGSDRYWEQRYASGGHSGVGSYHKFADFKAQTINAFIYRYKIQSVIEFGCGDGNQLSLADYPRYVGFDVSQTIIDKCKKRFAADENKTFKLMEDYNGEIADLALSLDVIYHLVEDDVFDSYMRQLFAAAEHYVIIYSSDTDDNNGYEGTHVRHRCFSNWVGTNIPGWDLIEHVPNKHPYTGDYRTGSFADFYIFKKAATLVS